MSGNSAARAPGEPWLFPNPGASRGIAPPPDAAGLPVAVLFDRDGTLVADVPYNGEPACVVPMPSAVEALAAVRALGIPVGVVSNQSGVARGLLTRHQVAAVQRRVEAFLGPFDIWAVCPHGPDDGCRCRKPAPGLVLAACDRLGVCPARTAVIGDIGSDVAAALAAGARGVLVPTPATRPEEIAAAPDTAPDLLRAVRLVLDPTARCRRPAPPDRASAPDRPAPVRPGPASGTETPAATAGADTGGPTAPRGTDRPRRAVAVAAPGGSVPARAGAPAPAAPGRAGMPGRVAAAPAPSGGVLTPQERAAAAAARAGRGVPDGAAAPADPTAPAVATAEAVPDVPGGAAVPAAVSGGGTTASSSAAPAWPGVAYPPARDVSAPAGPGVVGEEGR
ncbi:D-glycero-alpha-D-manno-heptose-1,7-bisphosphate 7-phosphatase [Streptomyces xantholiticus]|uniref:D-glycero-alpha-D-manno-heptose-1,7-bisphosphate 7-phosphatase n=1 Tax=Streptomyces xantholiticus TaxID=68285 RepID=UPI0016766EB0|nr:hypothetical protein GCM10010381_47530 [Streptomyces xantholiticus]